jgi:hypothetical protein
MDDLFLALVRRGGEQNLARQARALESPQPLRALWEFSSDPTGTALTMELAALANHRKAIRAELAAYGEQFRRLQGEALAGVFARYDVDPEEFPPAAMLVVMTAISRILGLEDALGMTAGHAETRALIERFLARYEGDGERD